MNTANWTPGTVDDALEVLLPLEDKRSYERACSELAEEMGAGVADVRLSFGMVRDGDPVNWLLWGLSLRIKEYDGPAAEASRKRRIGPLSWVERKVIGWAVNGRSSKQKIKPDARYVARILQRTEDEVEPAMRKAGPDRGREGFFKR